MKRYTFKTREEVEGFLSKFDFLFYIPRLQEPCANKADDYYVEVTDNEKLNYCSIRYLS